MANSVRSAMPGCDVKCSDDNGFQEAVSAVERTQAVIGLDKSQERCASNNIIITT